MEERPDILQTGHIHQAFYYKQDNTHCFQTSCLEDQTPYCRGLGLANDKSCWWVDIEFDDKGNVHGLYRFRAAFTAVWHEEKEKGR